MRAPAATPALASRACAVVLIALAAATPWAFGAVQPLPLRIVVVVGLAVAAGALLVGAVRGGLPLPELPRWPLAAFLALALLQLLPVPEALHRWLAPGSSAVWRPDLPAAAAVLGSGPRPVSVDPATTLGSAALVAALGLLALLAAPALSHARVATAAGAVLAGSGFALSVYAILASARFGPLLYGTIPVPTVAPFGPFVNKNHFAGWTAMAALLVAGWAEGLAADARRRGRDWTSGPRAALVAAAIVAACAMALAVLASRSRGGVLALAAGAVALVGVVLWHGGRRRAIVSTLALPLLLGAAVLVLAPEGSRERLRSLSGASFRLETWRGSLRLFAASPLLGSGLGAFHDAYPRFKRGQGYVRVEHAESDYLELLAETGVLGSSVALVGLFLLLRRGTRSPTGESSAVVVGVAQGGAAALVALAVKSMLDFDLRIPSNAALGAFAVAAIGAASGSRGRPLGRTASALAATAVMVLLASLLGRPSPPPAGPELRLAANATSAPVRALRLARAEAALVATLRARPAQAESWLFLASVRKARGDDASARALASRALWLDPTRDGLRRSLQGLTGDAGSSE